MALDKETRCDIERCINDAIRHAMEGVNEKWVDGRELCEQFSCFTPFLLKKYGSVIPRARVTVVDGDNVSHSSWAYPRNKIQRLISENKLTFVVPATGICTTTK